MNEEQIERRIKILLSVQRALLGAIVPNLRRIFLDWNENEIRFYFVFDGDFSEEDQEEMECVAFEVSCDFDDDEKIVTNYLRIPAPEQVHNMGQACVFSRKEKYDD